MIEIILVVLILVLGLIFFQDLKQRAIHVILPVLVLVLSFLIINKKGYFNYFISLTNIGFLLLTLFILFIYMSIKNKKMLNPFQNHFGLGDLLFYIAISPLFVFRNYILFFILSLLFSLIMFLIFRGKMKEKNIPLAGFASLLLIFFLVKDYFIESTKMTLL